MSEWVADPRTGIIGSMNPTLVDWAMNYEGNRERFIKKYRKWARYMRDHPKQQIKHTRLAFYYSGDYRGYSAKEKQEAADRHRGCCVEGAALIAHAGTFDRARAVVDQSGVLFRQFSLNHGHGGPERAILAAFERKFDPQTREEFHLAKLLRENRIWRLATLNDNGARFPAIADAVDEVADQLAAFWGVEGWSI